MTITPQPESLCLTGNMASIRVTTDTDITMTLTSGNDELLTHTYSPTADNIVDINLRDIVLSLLSFDLKNQSTPYQQTMICRSFTVTLTDGTDTETVSFKALRAGVDNLSDTVGNFLQHNFLTWQPNVKPVTYYTPEFLTYYAQQQVVVKCLAHIAEGNETTVTLATISADTCVTIPVQYAIIAGLTNALPQWYDVWVETGGGTRLTYKQRYYAQDMRSEQEQWILFENSLGGIDTFRAYGDSDNTAEHTHNVAEIEEVSQEYRVDTERKYKKSTGRLDRNERLWLLDFFPSTRKYIYIGQSLRQIVVVESDVNYKASELPSSYTFTYRYADAKPYLNLPRTDVPLEVLDIQVPDVGSFTVAPRLVEFPATPLSDGALFPVQDPYSEEWGTTTFGAIRQIIAAMVSTAEESFAVLTHTHLNKSFLDGLSWDSIRNHFAGYFLSKTNADTANGVITFVSGLVSNAIAWFKQGIKIGSSADSTMGIDANGNAKLNSVTSDDIHSNGFSDDNIGGYGYHVYKDANGNGHVCTDILDVRKKARFTELEIRRLSYINADQVQSMAASKVEKVLPIAADGTVISSDDTTTTVVAYRCLAVADDGSTATKNGWALGDQARCQTFNITAPGNYQNVENRFYWRLVVRVGQCYDNGTIYPSQEEHDGKVYHFFDLANIMDVTADAGDEFDDFFADEYATEDVYEGYMITLVNNERTNLNDIPATEDAVVQMGNKIDTDRMGFFITKADNLNTGPYIYAGVNNFTLVGKMITKITPQEVLISARKLKVFSDPNAGDASPLTHYRGDWEPVNGVNPTSYYYDEWDYQGSRWLCIFEGANGTTEAPGATPANWKQISLKGDKGDKGDSVVIAGYAEYYYGETSPSKQMPDRPNGEDQIALLNYPTRPFMIYASVLEDFDTLTYEWEGRNVPYGTCYIYRVNNHLYQATRNGWQDLGRFKGEDGTSVSYDSKHSSLRYAVSQYGTAGSGRQYPSDISSWQNTMPAVQKGKYLWTKDTTAYNNGGTIVYDVTYGVTYWPNDGESVEIDTENTFVRYSTVKTASQPADSTFTLSYPPELNQGDYLWCLSQVKYVGIDTPLKSYSVSRVGTDGDDGDPGSDGYTTHFAYAKLKSGQSIPSSGKLTTAMVDQWGVVNFVGADAIGTYRDQTGTDSSDINSYTWTKWKGDKGEDGSSVMAQYAPNNNPSSSQIHDTWQTGDIYMRTKSSSAGSWSDWHKIVGESGDETDYSFNISSALATNNPSDPTIEPSPCGLLEWADAPVATTSTYPYLWMRIVKKTWNASTQSYTSGTPTYVRITGKDGQDGQDGEDGADGYSVTLTPSTIIINQSEDEDGNHDFPLLLNDAYAIIDVKKGNAPVDADNILVTSDRKANVSKYWSKATSGAWNYDNSLSTGQFKIKISSVLKQNSGDDKYAGSDGNQYYNYYREGRIILKVTPAGSSNAITLYLDFKCNLQGTLKTTIKGDVETTVAEKITYGYNNETGSVGSLQAVGKYIRSSEKNIALLTETIGSTNYGNNLFGFSKGIMFNGIGADAIPFVQGYGFAVVNTYNGHTVGRARNLGFDGKTGYYVVTCEIKMPSLGNGVTAVVNINLCDVAPESGTIDNNKCFIATNQWKKFTAVFNIPSSNPYVSENSLNGFFDIENIDSTNPTAQIFVRYLQIEHGSVPSAFGICTEDAQSLLQEPITSEFVTASEGAIFDNDPNNDLNGLKHFKNREAYNDVPAYWQALDNMRYINIVEGNGGSVYNVESGCVYTLSFWAKGSINGMSIHSYLYARSGQTPIIDNFDGVDADNDDNTGRINVDGNTETFLTTSWKKYYIHWYIDKATGPRTLIVARLEGYTNADEGTRNNKNLNGVAFICGIRFDKGYVTSANRTEYETVMKQTARRMDFSVLVNSMEKAGIHMYTENNGTPENEAELAKGVIDLAAGKVNFVDPNGDPYQNPKVSIDPRTGTLKAINGEFEGKVTATSGSFTGSLTLPADSGVFSYGGTDTTYGAFGLYMNSSLAISGQRTDYRNGGTTRGAVLRIEAARTNSSYRGIYCKGDAEVQGITQLLKASTSDSYNALIAEGITDKGELTVDGNFNANGQMILGVSILNTGSSVILPKCAKGRVMICPGATTVGKATGVTLRDSTGSTVNSLSPNGRPRIFVAYDTDKWQEFYTG